MFLLKIMFNYIFFSVSPSDFGMDNKKTGFRFFYFINIDRASGTKKIILSVV